VWGRRWWCGGGRDGGHGWRRRWSDCVAGKEELGGAAGAGLDEWSHGRDGDDGCGEEEVELG